jgi:biopolymer transport protein ExbD
MQRDAVSNRDRHATASCEISETFCTIEGTPFVSVAVTLAAILLFIPLGIVEHPGNSGIELAKVNHPIYMPGASSDDALVVTVTRNGWVFFASERVTPEEMSSRACDRLTHVHLDGIYMMVDARASYSDVAGVLNSLRAARITRVGFLLDQRIPERTPLSVSEKIAIALTDPDFGEEKAQTCEITSGYDRLWR